MHDFLKSYLFVTKTVMCMEYISKFNQHFVSTDSMPEIDWYKYF